MEQVRDLLDSKPKKAGGLDVRQHPTKGFYGTLVLNFKLDVTMVTAQLEPS